MKKISVITLLNIANYGSVLQTYATQNVLLNMGYEVEFVDYYRGEKTTQNKKDYGLKRGLIAIYRRCIGDQISKRRKRLVFRDFLTENINLTKHTYHNSTDLLNDIPQADIYCTGSDQMWNSIWNGGIENAFYLSYVKDKPKFAFSTSIGMTEFPENELDTIKSLLDEYSFITVREQSAVDLLQKYGIHASLVLDPTMMVTGAFWREFCKKETERLKTEKYILVYNLNSTHNVDLENYTKTLSKELKLPIKIINYGLKVQNKFGQHIFLPSIKEFVALFNNATYVVTDSFHGLSFCLNLNKQFSVIYPPRFYTRLQNILRLTGLESRVVSKLTDEIHSSVIDYDKVNEIINKERAQSLQLIQGGIAQCAEGMQ